MLLLALVFRLANHAAMAQQPDSFAPLVDSEAYLLQALRVAAGEPLVDGVTFQAPLYPWLLGWALRASGDPGATGISRAGELRPERLARALAVGRAFNLACGLLLVLLLWRLGVAFGSPAAGLWAAALAALSSPLVFYEGHLLKVSLSVIFLPWAVLAAQRAWRLDRARPWLWVGVALGLGGLVRGNMHLLAWLAIGALAWHGWRRDSLRAGLARGAWLLVGAWLALAPLVVRNSLVAGRPVLATAAGGTAFFLCNHAGNDTGLVEHTALNRQVPRHEEQDWRQRAESATGRALTPVEVSRFWMDRALTDIAEDPWRWGRLEVRKLGLLVSRYEAPDNTLVAFGEQDLPLLALTPSRWEVVLPLAFGGLVLAWLRRRKRARPGAASALALAAAGYAATLLAFNMTSRFRMPVEPLGMVWAGLLLSSLPVLVRQATTATRLAVVLAVLAGLGAGRLSEGPLGPLDAKERAGHLAVRFLNRSLVARERGDLVSARADLTRAAETSAAAGLISPAILVELAAYARADALSAEGRAAAARRDHPVADEARERAAAAEARQLASRRAQEALRISPGHGDAHRLLGMLAYDVGDHASAVSSFRASLAAVPLDRDARLYLCLSLLAMSNGEQARGEAERLVAAAPEDDAGHGLLALARLQCGDRAGARSALEVYDRLASMRESAGLPRRLPDQPALVALREAP